MLILSRFHSGNFIWFKNKLWSYSYSLLNDIIHISPLLYLQSSSVFYSVAWEIFPIWIQWVNGGKKGPHVLELPINAVDGFRISVSVVSGKVFTPLVTFSFSCLFLRSKPTEEHVEWRTFNYRLWLFWIKIISILPNISQCSCF